MPATLIDSLTEPVPPRAGSWLDVECVDRSCATVYLSRSITSYHLLDLYRVANALPRSVHTLRVQLGGADADAFTMDALRTLVRMWRYRGPVHLVFAGRADPRRPYPSHDVGDRPAALDMTDAATTAAFL
ncbi:MAG TPA: hypothetical protein VJU87_00030 [Gemmatimonadaceae bacterium]|nr:hypothetical protein [Gemmatimonadaceae bacterium]